MPLGTTNPFFDNVDNFGEQELLFSLNDEALTVFGQDVYYVPRTLNEYDPVFGNDPSSSYTTAIQIVAYPVSVDGFLGNKDFIAKMSGLLIRDGMTWILSQRIFSDVVGVVTGQVRPLEGDIIFFPLNHRCFQITFVEKFGDFYPLGILPTWKVETDLFEYSNETFSTGVPDIDRIMVRSQDVMGTSLTDSEGNFIEDQEGNAVSSKDRTVPGDDTSEIGKEADAIITWDESDPFSEGT